MSNIMNKHTQTHSGGSCPPKAAAPLFFFATVTVFGVNLIKLKLYVCVAPLEVSCMVSYFVIL